MLGRAVSAVQKVFELSQGGLLAQPERIAQLRHWVAELDRIADALTQCRKPDKYRLLAATRVAQAEAYTFLHQPDLAGDQYRAALYWLGLGWTQEPAGPTACFINERIRLLEGKQAGDLDITVADAPTA